MYTTQLDNGITNNYAVEPELTYADYPSYYQQRRYIQQGAVAALFVTVLLFIAFGVS
ncbi:MAG: ssl1498 family light-harvesting-like protein [Xenococcaceae cyanobacterium]